MTRFNFFSLAASMSGATYLVTIVSVGRSVCTLKETPPPPPCGATQCWKAFLVYQKVKCIITARIRKMGEGNIFTLCVSPHLDPEGGGYPSQVWMVEGGYPG